MPVNTAKVDGRRKLDYKSLDEILADAGRLSSGPVKLLGNWSPGQIFRHLATAFNGSIDGFTMTFPWYFRLMAKLFKNKLLNGPMPAGFKLPSDGERDLAPHRPRPKRGWPNFARPFRVSSESRIEPNTRCSAISMPTIGTRSTCTMRASI